MKAVIDANISWRIAKKLEPYFEIIFHADSLPMEQPAEDIEIWKYAYFNEFLIITQDTDFRNFAVQLRDCPKIVLICTGNLSTNELTQKIIEKHQAILDFYNNLELVLFEIY
jgi:predicted nuclease of predicted toxin-antitoxin system